jgi:BirA family biotin operon repressor/biotin-[acetyl-CoA-carboxylase] ligase
MIILNILNNANGRDKVMTDEDLLKILQENTDFISGERISETLHISRTAVWKAVNKLKAKGYAILSVSHRGYRLVSCADILSPGELDPFCRTAGIGRPFIYSESCVSTNDEAKSGGLSGAKDGTVYITDRQTKGRGRMGKDWHCEEKKGIAMSILLRPSIAPSQVMPLSLLTGLCTCKALEEMTGLPFQVKWPNDVVISGKKAAGMLIEMSTIGEMVQFIVIGIGINVNNTVFPEDLASVATSVFLETDRDLSRQELVCRVLWHFEQGYARFMKEADEADGWDGADETGKVGKTEKRYKSGEADGSAGKPRAMSIVDEYKSRCVNLGKQVSVHQRGSVYTGIAKDITPAGELVILLPDGKERVVMSGEVSVRGIYGYA